MKKQMTTSAQFDLNVVTKLTNEVNLTQRLTNTELIKTLSDFFSSVLEEEVSPMQTLCFLNAFLAFFMLVFPVGIPFVLRIIFLCWFVLSLLQCRQAGMGR